MIGETHICPFFGGLATRLTNRGDRGYFGLARLPRAPSRASMGVGNRVHPPGGQHLPTLRARTLGIPLLGLCLAKMLPQGPRDLLVDNPCTITGKSRNTEAGYKPITVAAE